MSMQNCCRNCDIPKKAVEHVIVYEDNGIYVKDYAEASYFLLIRYFLIFDPFQIN